MLSLPLPSQSPVTCKSPGEPNWCVTVANVMSVSGGYPWQGTTTNFCGTRMRKVLRDLVAGSGISSRHAVRRISARGLGQWALFEVDSVRK
jgi:hypothetical protein